MQGTLLVTSCSSGIDATVARELVKSGHGVYSTARHPEAPVALEAEGIRSLALE